MRSKSIGALNLGKDVDYIVIGGVIVAGIVLYKWLVPPPTGQQTSTSGTTLTPDQAAQDAQSTGETPNYDQTQYASWASAIQSEGFRIWPYSDGTQTLAIMDQMDNLADVYSLIAAFGNYDPSGLPGILGYTYTLPAWIHAAFKDSAIAAFNQQLAWNNVQFSF